MALVVAPYLFIGGHYCSNIYTSSYSGHSRRSFFSPRASLSLSTHIPKSNNNSTYQQSLSQKVTQLCESGNLIEALNSLKLVSKHDVSSSHERKEAMGVLLQACGRLKDIGIGREVHRMVSGSTLFSNDFVLNTRIITMYSSCGSPLDSRSVFDGLQRRNLFQWNAIVSGYTRNEMYGESLSMFIELISGTDYVPDKFTLPCVIKACAGILDVGLGLMVHGMAVKMGLVLDVFVGNALISMYGKCGFVEGAVKVFKNMTERNLVSWNSMILAFSQNGFAQESFEVFRQMMDEERFKPDVATLVTVLPLCAVEGEVEFGKLIHGLGIKLGLVEELTVNNSLVNMYSKCMFLSEAQILFENFDDKTVVSWNTIIGGGSANGDICATFNLLRKMSREEEKLKVNEVTILNVLSVCLEKSALPSLKELHGYSIRHGFQYDQLVANAFVAAYAKCGSMVSAVHVFIGIENKTVSSWNALIGGYAQNDNPRKALDFYLHMTHSGLEPDRFSIGSLLLACGNLKSSHYGKEIHGFVLRNGLEKDSFIGISLLSLYIHCGKLYCARVIFERLKDRCLVSWNAMIAGFLQNGHPEEALIHFNQMLFGGIQPDSISLTSVFGACSKLSALRLGIETHCFALKTLLIKDIFVSCSIIDMYAKSGCIEQARQVFDKLMDKDVASWNAIISGYGVHGQGNDAMVLFDKMQSYGHKPDSFTLIGILMACNHSGMVDEGLKIFNQMKDLYQIDPKLEHFSCVVDMLGRAGRLDEALRLIEEMPKEPDVGIWSSLLSSCRTHGNLSLGEKVAKRLLDLEPDKAETYVSLSNLFAGSGKWNDVRRVRQTMNDKGLQKDAGRSWIELGGKVYNFLVGDNLQSDTEEIREKWRRVEKEITEIGYKPNTDCVLHELDEEEKIEILRGHSEKLAISFGLLKTQKGTTLRISKNLRICLDCHNAVKLASKVVEREIIVRDNKRFHHFRDGFCSCGDYW